MTEKKHLFVLLVEDEPSIREITAMILEDDNMTVHTASSGDEAETWLETGKVDVLFTDINMPGKITGKELATRHSDMPVLVTSGEAQEQHGWLQEGMAYLAKPYDRRTLLAAVRGVAG
jgi:DNA-binding response OmpR family regulator